MEQQKVADELRIALMGRGYDVTSDGIEPSGEQEYYSFTVRGHAGASARG